MSAVAPKRIPEATWLVEPPLSRVLEVLNADGIDTRVVGGAVRNSLLGEAPGDVDLATSATPEIVSERITRAGMKVVPTGIAHGTVTVVADGRPYEVTTLRHDVETHGRRATVAFGADWEADARRRDFTINALYVGGDGRLFDPIGGYPDIVERRVRFIGDAVERIREDYLRILRFFRFHARYGRGAPDPAGLSAAISERGGLRRLSAERIRHELVRLLAATGAPETAEVMADAGILSTVLGSVVYVPAFSRLPALEDGGADPLLRLVVLAARIPEDADRLAGRLRLSRAEHGRIAAAVDGWWRIRRDMTEAEAKALMYRIGAQAYRDRARLAWSASGDTAADPVRRAMLTLADTWSPPAFPLAGADLVALGAPKGPRVGALLRRIEEEWISEEFSAGRRELIARAKQLVADDRVF